MPFHSFAFLKFFILFAFIGTVSPVYAQHNAHSLELNLQRSIDNFSADKNFLQGNAYGGELIYHYNVNRNPKKWSSDLGIKSIDLIFNYKRMSNVTLVANPQKGEFGDTFSLLGGLTFPILSVNKVELVFTPGLGLLYAGESWFSNQNPIVGSRLNLGLKAGLKANVPLSEKTAVSANLDILHYSNGGTRVPNNGLNTVSVGLSVTRALNSDVEVTKPTFENENYNKHSFELGINVGRRGAYQSRNGLYKTGLYGGYNYRLNSYLALGAGVDAIYYFTVYDPNRNLETFQSKASSFGRWRVGAAIGPDLWMGKLGIMAKYGYYIHYDSLLPVKTYWTTGVRYKLNNWVGLQAKGYIHQTDADYVGFGLIFTK